MKTQTLSRENTLLLLIDVQERLMPTIAADMATRAVHNCLILLQAAPLLKIPVLSTEQYPKGLGRTIEPLRQVLSPDHCSRPKTTFSCVPVIDDALRESDVRSVIVCGMETHVCVLLTTLDLLRQGYAVWVARDACMSRTSDNWHAGLHLCEQAGATVAPTETILFMMMGGSAGAEFKAISKFLK